MAEDTVELSKISGRKSEFKVVAPPQEINVGAETKARMTLAVGERQVSMIRKKVNLVVPEIVGLEEAPINPAEFYIKAWSIMKERGLPVVDTVRVASENEVFMTDLTQNGSTVYSDRHDDNEIALERRKYKETDDKLKQINIEELQREAIDLGQKATDQGIELPWDDPVQLLVTKDGDWRLIVLDIGHSKIWVNKADAPRESIGSNNQNRVLGWVSHQQRLMRYIDQVLSPIA